MNAMIEQINSVGKAFTEFGAAMLIQSSVLIGILLVVDLMLRKKVRVVFRYWIWMLVLVKLVLPSSISSPVSIGYLFADKLANINVNKTATDIAPVNIPPIIEIEPAEVTSTVPAVMPPIEESEPAVTKAVSPPETAAAAVTWQGVVFVVWLAVVIAMGLLLAQRAMFVCGLVKQAKEANALMKDALEFCCERMGIKGKISLKISANATSPAVCGLFQPVILLPQNLGPSLGARDLRAVLMHELAHIKRGDLWVNLAQTILQIIYFYNPSLWLANAIIRRVREQAVDEMVQVAMGEAAVQYPQTLVNVAKLAFKRPVLSLRLIGVVESESALKGRIRRMLDRPIPKSAKLGAIGLVVVIIAGAILLPMAAGKAGEPTLVIKGAVTDAATGKPIIGAKVFDDGYGPEPDWQIIKAGEQFKWGAISDANGRYSFLTWPEHHSFKIEADGYKSQRKTLYSGHFTLNKKDVEIFDYALEPLATENSQFKAILPNGVTVELVGVCEHPSEGKQWWKANGNPIEDNLQPYHFEEFRRLCLPLNQQENKILEVAVKAINSSNKDVGIICSGANRTFVNCRDNVWGGTVEVSKKLGVKNFKVGVAAGAWETLARSTAKFGRIRISNPGIVFTEAYDTQEGYAVVTVTHKRDIQKENWRVVAIDEENKLHEADLYQTQKIDGFEQNMVHFKRLRSKQIRRFEFQSRPYEWVTFRNVSLRPGVKTAVEIEGKKDVIGGIVTVKQRSTQTILGSAGQLAINIGDITAGQVQFSLIEKREKAQKFLIPTQSVKTGDVLNFEYDNHSYKIKVVKLINYIVGEDEAIFEISAKEPAAGVESEENRKTLGATNWPWHGRIATELSPKLIEERDKLLAEADTRIRSGLLKLSETFPQLKKARDYESVITEESAKGRINIVLRHTHKGKGRTTKKPVPENEQSNVLVLIQPPPEQITAMGMFPLYPNLGLVGQVTASAGNTELDVALKELVSKTLEPLRRLNEGVAEPNKAAVEVEV